MIQKYRAIGCLMALAGLICSIDIAAVSRQKSIGKALDALVAAGNAYKKAEKDGTTTDVQKDALVNAWDDAFGVGSRDRTRSNKQNAEARLKGLGLSLADINALRGGGGTKSSGGGGGGGGGAPTGITAADIEALTQRVVDIYGSMLEKLKDSSAVEKDDAERRKVLSLNSEFTALQSIFEDTAEKVKASSDPIVKAKYEIFKKYLRDGAAAEDFKKVAKYIGEALKRKADIRDGTKPAPTDIDDAVLKLLDGEMLFIYGKANVYITSLEAIGKAFRKLNMHIASPPTTINPASVKKYEDDYNAQKQAILANAAYSDLSSADQDFYTKAFVTLDKVVNDFVKNNGGTGGGGGPTTTTGDTSAKLLTAFLTGGKKDAVSIEALLAQVDVLATKDAAQQLDETSKDYKALTDLISDIPDVDAKARIQGKLLGLTA